MKIKPCKRCQNVDVFGRYQYCPECKEVVEAELKAGKNKRDKERYKQKIGGEYKYNKNYGLEQPKPVDESKLTPAALRWKRMSWNDVIIECMRLGIEYKDSQIMVGNGTLPESFGLGVT